MEQKDIISRLSKVGKHFRLSNTALAHKAGLGVANFAKMMKGEQKITDKTLKKISLAYGVSFDWLLTGEGSMLNYAVSQIGDDNNQQGDGNIYRNNDEKAYKTIMMIVETNQMTTEHFIEIVKKSQEQIDRLIALLEKK